LAEGQTGRPTGTLPTTPEPVPDGAMIIKRCIRRRSGLAGIDLGAVKPQRTA